MFAYYFPPLGGSGVQRTLKYVKYLPDHGFEPLVITGQPRWSTQVADEALLREIPPSTFVVEAPTIPFDYVQGKVDGLLRRVGITSRLVRGCAVARSTRRLDTRRGLARAPIYPQAPAVDPLSMSLRRPHTSPP